MVPKEINLIDKIDSKLPSGYNLRPLKADDFNKGNAHFKLKH